MSFCRAIRAGSSVDTGRKGSLGSPMGQPPRVMMLFTAPYMDGKLPSLVIRGLTTFCTSLAFFDAVTHCEDTGLALECHLTGYLYEIFSVMISANQTRISSAYDEHFYKAQQYIKAHYDDPSLSVSGIADYVGINRSHLYKVFDQIARQSVSSYILDFRLKKAASLLRNSSAKIGEIANSCGFSEQSYFSNVFQKNYGLSPSQYRKNPPESEESGQNSISIPS